MRLHLPTRAVRPGRAHRRPSAFLAVAAATIVAAPFIAVTASESVTSPRPADKHRPLAQTGIDQFGLDTLPAVVADLAETGLDAAGVRLPDLLGAGSEPTSPSAGSGASGPTSRPGAVVQHLVRDSPLKMVAFTWDRPVDTDMLMRAKRPDGMWGEWTKLSPIDAAHNPTADRPSGTEPVWVGDAREVQVAMTDRSGLAIPAAAGPGGSLVELGVTAASAIAQKVLTTALSTVKATLISPESLLSLGSSLLTPLLGGPQVVARTQWGADESIRCSQPTFSPTVKAAIVHHTAGSNDYTPEQSVEIVRGIYAYHARTLNWCDIGYNALVDKYGQIFEGAFGGLDRNVEGTHTGGFNRETVGVTMIGDLDKAAPSAAMTNSVARFLKWRLNKAGINPLATAQLRAEPFTASRFPAGAMTNLPTISGHRDYNSTSCPGEHGMAALGVIRAMVGGTPAPAPESPAPGAPAPAPESPAPGAPAAPPPAPAAPAPPAQ